MSIHVEISGIIPADQKWQEYLGVYRKCRELGVEPPEKVVDYLGAEDWEPDMKGRQVDLTYEGSAEYEDGAFVDLDSLPDGVKIIRVWMS